MTATAPAGPAWREVAPPPPPKPISFLLPAIVVWFPFVAQFGKTYPHAYRMGPALALALVLSGLVLRRWPWALPGVVVAAVLAFDPMLGSRAALRSLPLVIVSFALLGMATGALPVPIRRLTARRLRPCIVPLVPAGLLLMWGHGLDGPTVLIGIAAASVAVPLAVPDRVDRLLDRFGHRGAHAAERVEAASHVIGRAIGALAMVPALVLGSMVWVGQRIVGYHPLPQQRGWRVRQQRDPDPVRLYSGAVAPPSLGRRLHRAAAPVVVIALLGLGWSIVSGRARDAADRVADVAQDVVDPCGRSAPDPAMDQDPAWPQISCEISEFGRQGRFDAITTYTMADYEGRWVNVVDGARATWQPPACEECPTVTMWIFGGSAAFGWWQRDDFSFASALAKAAWEEGIRLEITTRAMPGWVHGQESRLFADLVLREEQLPDVALFYHGGNDLNRQFDRDRNGRGDDESATSFAEAEIDALLRSGPFPWNMRLVEPGSPPSGDQLEPEEVAEHAMARYLRDLEHTRRVADAAGVTPIFVWQPLMPAAPASSANPDAMVPEDLAWWKAALPVALDLLPSDVIDLSDALDEVDRPVFKDLWHTNERGSAVVAAALLEEVLPTLRESTRGG